MIMKTWKKNLVAGAVLFCVCAGIYTNWYYTEQETAVDLTDTLNADKILSDDTLVMGDDVVLTDEAESTMSQYFASVRLSRQEARDSAVSLLQEAMAYNDDAQSAASEDQLEEIVQTALCEAQIESLVIAKGYVDCVAYIGEEGISVAVAAPEGGLSESDVAVIADIVLTQSQFDLEDIRIVEVH